MSATADLLVYCPSREEAAAAPGLAGPIAPDCAGMNFYDIDPSLRTSLRLNMPPETYRHFETYFRHLGGVAGGRLDALARLVDRNPPALEHRDRFGNDVDNIIYHPAYREMEKIGFEDFKMHAMCHAPGHFGLDRPAPQAAKYVFQYLISQSEFGMMCPLSITDATIHVLNISASAELKNHLLPKMLSTDLSQLWKGTQFMTERAGGSDVSSLETTAREKDGVWRLYGDKWFASHTDAHVALILARPEGAPGGNAGIALFALPRHLPDGSRNNYRIVRMKEKLGTKSLATCEIKLEGAQAYLVGNPNQGLKQMMGQVNMSRLSHGVRAAGMMRRCLNEALQVARHRRAFGSRIIDHPLLRRQVMKILVPAEQALALSMLAASHMDRARAGSNEASQVIRILTPLVKFRACRDAIAAARAAMETRGGNGYIEEWVNARLVRDSHIGVLWEGTSNINAIDVVRRAVGKARTIPTPASNFRRKYSSRHDFRNRIVRRGSGSSTKCRQRLPLPPAPAPKDRAGRAGRSTDKARRTPRRSPMHRGRQPGRACLPWFPSSCLASPLPFLLADSQADRRSVVNQRALTFRKRTKGLLPGDRGDDLGEVPFCMRFGRRLHL